jgi:hypothetical protein
MSIDHLTASPADLLIAGRDALSRGAWEEARTCFERSLAATEAAEGLAQTHPPRRYPVTTDAKVSRS